MRRLAFLGPPGTFTEEAAILYDPQAQLLSFASIGACAASITSDVAEEGVVPIENSLEGSVTETLDVLIHDSHLSIGNELILPIEHYLLAKPGLASGDVKVVYSHPQALAQCRRFLERSLPGADVVAALSTAAAVEEMMARDSAAAIGNRRAAKLYGASVLADGIQDKAGNVTRFVVLARADQPPTGHDKTSLAFTFAVEDRPGLLAGALDEFASRQINLSKIESRPSRERLGTYIFLVDVDGHRLDADVAEALARVEANCSFFRVLGSYPRYREG
ncbi:MAG: prephenate dehydratase [Dehalococcoidia bacterium]